VIFSGEEMDRQSHGQEQGIAPQITRGEERKTDPAQEASGGSEKRWQDRTQSTPRAYPALYEQIPVKKQKPHSQQIPLC